MSKTKTTSIPNWRVNLFFCFIINRERESCWPYMTICRPRFPLVDSTRSSRHPYSRLFDSPSSSCHLHDRDTFTTYWGPVLIVVSDLPSWVRSRVWRWCGTNLCVVSWDIHLWHFVHQVSVLLWVVVFGVLEVGVTLVLLSDRNLGWPPFQTSVVMTQGGGCVSEQYESIKRKLKIRCTWVSVWWKTTI